ncbi:glycosyltransferase [Burkholderia vietnamiensis]|jgi:rhamnosyl/mannosyltransferase|uniref:Glycosyl transferase n=1 Tax=Burkholderia vietnamiensis TaxID=60552 RepID=A0AA44XXM2_BURVI|nr:glycosyltransferase [Burkholderia vietnamiensis]KVS05680.1 glycosyl transferase [Burkholderia vietnamiensis]PRH38192.1 glycosyl transferase [Burkholderia vietnamiensis]
MKVLHVYRTYFPDPPGGLQEAIRHICLATRERDVEARIFTLSPTPDPREVRFPEAVVTRAKSWAAPASCDLGGVGAFGTYRELAKWADVLHFHYPWPFADLLHLLVATGKPAVMTYHSDIVRQKWLGAAYAPLMRGMLRSMSAVVATSPAYAKSSTALTQVVDPARLATIPLGIVDYRDEALANGVPSTIVERLGLAGQPYFLALGVLRYYKGLHTLIEAARGIAAKVVIAGTGPERESLQALAQRVGAENVIFTGQVSHDEKIALLHGCRALVLPSHLRSEAFGMVLVEAAMFGKPQVCCEVGSGTSYVNEHGVTGFVVPPESPDEFAAAVGTLLADSALAERMGAAARRRYEAMFSGPALGAAYDALYQQVIARG